MLDGCCAATNAVADADMVSTGIRSHRGCNNCLAAVPQVLAGTPKQNRVAIKNL